MKFLFDFLPVLLFFVAYQIYDIYVATATAMAASGLQIGWLWLKHRRVERMALFTFVLIMVLGGTTLALQDDAFIKWKPTAVNWLFGAVFLGSLFVGKKTAIEYLVGGQLKLPAVIWVRLNLGWAAFFLAMGIANLYVAFYFDTDTWVNFKLFGMLGLTLAFVVAQAFYLARHIETGTEAS